MLRWSHFVRLFLGGGAFPHELWFLLEVPGRRFVQPPERLADRLQLSPTSRVLEIGPGSGFFSVALAKRVPAGSLVVLDLRQEFAVRVKRKLSKYGLRNFACAVGDACSLPFRDGTFDAAVLVTVLGETSNPRACVREVCRVLRAGGGMLVEEHWLDPDFVSAAELRTLADSTDFDWPEMQGSPRNYSATFRKSSTPA